VAEAHVTDERLLKAAEALRALGIEADAPDQSGNAPGFRDRLVLNVRGICVDEFSDWVSIELRHLDPNSEWYEDPAEPSTEPRYPDPRSDYESL
jgi:hypothetical protein